MEYDEEFLTSFFLYVSQLNFDKAKEIVEREREAARHAQPAEWNMLLAHLPQIAVAEKSYLDLGFLAAKNKGFLRKDNSLRAVYDSLRTDFRRVEEVSRTVTNSRTINAVANQLCQFLTARIELNDYYEKMYAMGMNKQMKYEELVLQIEEITCKHSLSFSHLVLTAVKAAFSLECEILAHLLRAQLEMQLWRFLPALMQLQGAHTRISAWEKTLQNKDSWKFSATFLKTNQLPALLQWLLKLKGALVAKFALYFYATLVQQTTTSEMKVFCGKASVDYYQKILSFHKQQDTAAVMLVFNAVGVEGPVGPGYHHPDRPVEILQEYDCYPIIFSYPMKPLNHMHNVVYILNERAADLVPDKVVYQFIPMEQRSYFLAVTDPRITLIVAFDCKKSERESNIMNFMSELSSQLRFSKVFVNLKSTSK